MTWALRRQIFYICVVVLFILALAAAIIYPSFNKAPSCFDGVKNGTETGIDCGGSCALACTDQVSPISLLWSRSFKVVDGRYNAVAYLENHNRNTAVDKISYRFRFADSNNVYIGKREGTTFVPPSGRFAIFEPAIDVGNSVPVFVTFEFTEAPSWVQVAQDKVSQAQILTSDIALTDETTAPRMTATVKNNSFFIIPDVNIVAILYDTYGNAVATSQTHIDTLAPEETRQVAFTWPEPMSAHVVAEDVIPEFNIFSVRLK